MNTRKMNPAVIGFFAIVFLVLAYYGLVIYSFKRQEIALPALLIDASSQAAKVLDVPAKGLTTITYFDDELISISNSNSEKTVSIKSIESLSSALDDKDLHSRILIFYGGNRNIGKGINSEIYRDTSKEKKILNELSRLKKLNKKHRKSKGVSN